jgi:hypothetical protein
MEKRAMEQSQIFVIILLVPVTFQILFPLLLLLGASVLQFFRTFNQKDSAEIATESSHGMLLTDRA